MNTNKRKRGRPSGTGSYEAYSKEYDRVKAAMEKRGYTMASEKYTEAEWKRTHKAEINDRNTAIKEGKRKTVGNVNRDLVKEQQWHYSTAQARAQRKGYELRGGKEKVKLSDIKSGKTRVIDWNEISVRNKELRADGKSWDEVHQIISQEYFGS